LSSGRISGGELTVIMVMSTLNILLGSGMIKTGNVLVRPYFFNWPTTNNITPVNNETS
jgi:hypothetical protein